jgi:nitroreductase
MNVPAPNENRMPTAETLEAVVAKGDLSRLTAAQRVEYYHSVCQSIGLNPLTQPLQYITLQGRLVLYARREATDQLRKIHGISLAIADRFIQDGLAVVTVKATDKHGRSDEDLGVVAIAGLKGEAASNAMLKAITKAKRRATLSLCGLGFLDESELEGASWSDTDRTQPRQVQPAMPAAERSRILGTVQPAEAVRVELSDEMIKAREAFDAIANAPGTPGGGPAAVAETRPDSIGLEPRWAKWVEAFLASCRSATSTDQLNDRININSERLAELAALNKPEYDHLVGLVNELTERRAKLDGQANAES